MLSLSMSGQVQDLVADTRRSVPVQQCNPVGESPPAVLSRVKKAKGIGKLFLRDIRNLSSRLKRSWVLIFVQEEKAGSLAGKPPALKIRLKKKR